jgi:hypothetical protein
VQFGLQFTIETEGGKTEVGTETAAPAPPTIEAKAGTKNGAKNETKQPSAAKSLAQPKKDAKAQPAPPEVAKAEVAKAASPPTASKDEPTGEVVRLDRFRKK